MAKAQNTNTGLANKANYTPDQAKDFMNDILNGKDTPITWADCFSILENVPDNQLTELSGGEMIEWQVGETEVFQFEGFSDTVIKGKPVKLANLRDRQGKLWVTGAAMAISSLMRVNQLPAFVKIHCEGMEKSPNGDYFVLRCKTF